MGICGSSSKSPVSPQADVAKPADSTTSVSQDETSRKNKRVLTDLLRNFGFATLQRFCCQSFSLGSSLQDGNFCTTEDTSQFSSAMLLAHYWLSVSNGVTKSKSAVPINVADVRRTLLCDGQPTF